MSSNSRQELGPFMHAICFQYLRRYTEEMAGRAPIIAAGRKRGFDVIEGMGLVGKVTDPAEMKSRLDAALGADGTRLCAIQEIKSLPNGSFEVRLTESACTMNQTASEPLCAFTLGVFVGAIHALTGQRMNGHEVECQACDAPMCIYHIAPL